MNKKIKDFLTEVKEQKTKQLLGISLDMNYWKNSIKGKSEIKLRAELEEENNKRLITKTGNVIKDERDADKIAELSKDIEVIKRAEQEIVKLTDMEKNIKVYLEFVNSPSKDTVDKFEEILKIVK